MDIAAAASMPSLHEFVTDTVVCVLGDSWSYGILLTCTPKQLGYVQRVYSVIEGRD